MKDEKITKEGDVATCLLLFKMLGSPHGYETRFCVSLTSCGGDEGATTFSSWTRESILARYVSLEPLIFKKILNFLGLFID